MQRTERILKDRQVRLNHNSHNMNFVYPAFLFGLFALAIPVIIHLFNFRRFRTIYFTNVRFLKNIQEETATRNRLKHLLILASRLLALTFLVLAFAQPFIPSRQSAGKPLQKAVGIYIDNSFSMEAAENEEQLIDIAKRKAEEIVNGYSVDDKFQLLTNDMEAKHQRLLSKDEMLQMIREVQISPEVRPLNEIFKRQKDILNREGDKVGKFVYELSDFQKNAGLLENDTAFQIGIIPVTGSEKRNLTIDSVWFTTPVQMLDQPSGLCIRIKNYGEEEISNAPVTLKLNGQIKSLADVSIPANSEITDTLSFTVNAPGWYNGELSIKDYPVTFDDVFYFSFKPLSNIPVLSIDGNNKNDFIETLYGRNTLFALQHNPAELIEFSNIDTYDLIILNEVRSISGGLSRALTDQLARGCNVVIFPSPDADVQSLNAFLKNNNAGEYGNYVSRKRNVTEFNTQLPLVADVFEKIPKNLALPYADKSFEINAFSHTLEERILTFSDGKPMMARYPTDKGAIYLSAVPLDRTITDLPVQGGLFVPLMYKIAITTQKKSALYATIGEARWIALTDVFIKGDETLKVKSADNEFIPEVRKTGIATEVNLSAYTDKAGIYSIESGNAQQTEQSIALNYDRSESNLTFYSNDALKDEYNMPNFMIMDNINRDLSTVVTTLNEGTPLWKFCIIFVLIFLAAEILLIRLLP